MKVIKRAWNILNNCQKFWQTFITFKCTIIFIKWNMYYWKVFDYETARSWEFVENNWKFQSILNYSEIVSKILINEYYKGRLHERQINKQIKRVF